MQFDLSKSIQVLERTPAVLKALLEGLPKDWTAPNEGPDTWSPYDVVGHLIHGEVTDWIPRAEIILSQSGTHFTPFDRFAQFENSKGKNLQQLLDEFAVLRSQNIAKLQSFNLTEEDLKLEGTHPALGSVTLKNLLATWTVHDLNHIVQISRVMAKQYKEEVGVWTEYLAVLH
ncbi:MAG: DinB family protein [Ekhidna sp.]|uniref:DinB family protein n=1 Tax=Ekhidna sp. TaxID=2608089 RepID=UPI0032EC96D3